MTPINSFAVIFIAGFSSSALQIYFCQYVVYLRYVKLLVYKTLHLDYVNVFIELHRTRFVCLHLRLGGFISRISSCRQSRSGAHAGSRSINRTEQVHCGMYTCHILTLLLFKRKTMLFILHWCLVWKGQNCACEKYCFQDSPRDIYRFPAGRWGRCRQLTANCV